MSNASVRLMALVGAAALGSLLNQTIGLAAAAPATGNDKLVSLEPAINMLRAEVGQDRRDVVAASMLLTKSEGEIFWPLYDQYRAEQGALVDSKIRLIGDYIDNRDAMSQDQAAELVKNALAIEKKK